MVSLLNSQEMKSCKSRESFCLNILTIYTNDWTTFWHVYWWFTVYWFLNMCRSRTGWCTSIRILWKWASNPTELTGAGECRMTRFHPIRNFLANEMYHFSRLSHQTGCLFLPEQPAAYNELFIQPFLLVPEYYFA